MAIPSQFIYQPPKIDLNDQFKKACHLLEETKSNVFITGKAGTGKSTLLKYFSDRTRKNAIVLAPTGVAAINVGGQTIHSFFGFKPDITPDRVADIKVAKSKKIMYENIDAIVIDEISMVRADLLDCVDTFLQMHGKYKKMPFGGVQMIFFGDLYQLPPVVLKEEEQIFTQIYKSPYFFDAKAYPFLNVKTIELHKIYRQNELGFIDLLSSIRNCTVTKEHLTALNERHQPDFAPEHDDFYIYLTTTNAMADKINQYQLDQIDGEVFEHTADIEGKFEQKTLPTQETIELKIGAQVMLLTNDPLSRWFNGSIGKVTMIHQDELAVQVELSTGKSVSVTPFTWEMFAYKYNEKLKKLESEPVGSFVQFPLRLAWAITIHKSQGKTFPKVIVDIGYGAFAHGQTYVALSRCNSFKGLVLKRPIQRHNILLDRRIEHFMASQTIE